MSSSASVEVRATGLVRQAARVELAALVRLALPLVAGQLLLFGSNVVDTVLAGHLGPLVLGAVAIGSSIYILPLMVMQGLMFALPPSVSQLDGAGRRREAGHVFGQALWLALAVGGLLGLALHVGAGPLVRLLSVDPELAEGVAGFLAAIAWGMPALGLFMASRGLSDGLSLTRPTMWFGLLNVGLLLPIGYTLMYGVAGIPGQGAVGCGLATALVQWLSGGAYFAYVTRARRYRGIGPVWRLPDPAVLWPLLRLGVPMGVSVVLECALFSAAAVAIGRIGADAVSAHQVALNVAGLTFMVPLGVAGAITVRVGRAVGQGDPRGARLAGLVGIVFALATQSLCAAVMLTIPAVIAGVYTSDPGMQAAIVTLLGVAGLFQLSDGMQVAANGALRGIKDTRVPMLITLFAYWGIGFPVGLAFAFPAGLGAKGMWIGLLTGLSVAALLLTWRFLRQTGRGREIA